MAFYQVMFENKKYMSADLYMALEGVSKESLIRAPQKVVLDTIVFGPVTDVQEKAIKKMDVIIQDFDAHINTLGKVSGDERIVLVAIDEKNVHKYKNRRYVLMSKIPLDKNRRYALIPHLPVVRVCGRSMYVVLDAVSKEVFNPVVLTDKN